ncbi:tRNA lysidine(34) synthetase TilS [Campylobacter volucris]|uniref:tRNA(Ile)-lysidine synthase n=1 Tax=Campylobacter volucris TaxID=1031542 RepID=A0AAE5YHF6_9BACT|nr:tRNA lysidine(34) synthetase TilS [Campylobacter volucris]AJC93599.1 tRNA(Ile)-lysidine synthetase [Campylobacter volucris LMG 24379]KAB0579317.1 tRNA lysidine(34) synthetase TilS [Campylobacter volucris]QBL14010.1 tRNA lysidine(34) synthetase TilS [Campylobacter volucris]QEL07812.1 tRNA(Ile)-lysidine synthetase [Campylobacter volucris]TXK68219.1 tRNA lysidine(34) synthetase TilS [Campylobacter volucris]
MFIDDKYLNLLKNEKNLLAFSHGSDSSALFFMLLEQNIEFNLALINYKTRLSSDIEEQSAKELAKKYNKKIYIKIAPKIEKNFEANARVVRYEFFDEICFKYGYKNLILAHNLNDKFEWFLMQFSKGAGLFELLGFKDIEKRKNFTIVRPLIETSKKEILKFLDDKKIKYFHDESNDNEKYFRNHIRINYANEFLLKFEKGIKNSFKYLQNDLSFFDDNFKIFHGIYICLKQENIIAKCFKHLGILLSTKQRQEALKHDGVISHKIAIVYMYDKALIFPFIKCEKIPKEFRENCRKMKIPKLLRAFCFLKDISLKELNQALDSF